MLFNVVLCFVSGIVHFYCIPFYLQHKHKLTENLNVNVNHGNYI